MALIDATTGAELGATPPIFPSGLRSAWWQRNAGGLDTVLLVRDSGLELRDGASGVVLATSSPLGGSAAHDGGLVVEPDPIDRYRLRVVVGSYLGVQEFEMDSWRGLMRDGFE